MNCCHQSMITSIIYTQNLIAEHKVNRISFISKDGADSRSFSYVVGNDGGGHVLYGIKTEKQVIFSFKTNC